MEHPTWQHKIRAAQRAHDKKQLEAELKYREEQDNAERGNARKLIAALKFFGIEAPELECNRYELDGFTFTLKWLQGEDEKIAGVIRVSKTLGGDAWLAIERGDYEPYLREMWAEIAFNTSLSDGGYALFKLAHTLDTITENHAANIADYDNWKARQLDSTKSATLSPTLDEQLVNLLRQLVQQEIAYIRETEYEG